MNNKVKFLRGTSNEYAVAEKDSDTIYFTTDDGKLYIGDKEVSGDGSVTIDNTLSDTSTNPVQNKIVKQAIDNKADKSLYGDTTINVGRKADSVVGAHSTAEGYNTTASGYASHAEGSNAYISNGEITFYDTRTVTISDDITVDVNSSYAYGVNSHAEGCQTLAYGTSSHAEGRQTTASGAQSHAEGVGTIASGARCHAEGLWTIASGDSNHAEGKETTANGNNSCHAEGYQTTASGIATHAEGNSSNKVTDLITDFSWNGTTNDDIINAWNTQKFSLAHGRVSHVEGSDNLTLGHSSHAEGCCTVAIGNQSHTSGYHTKALHDNEAAYGKYNESNDNTLFSIGDGTADDARHNAFEITTDGGKLHDKDIAVKDDIINSNLLINPDFTINQRGNTGITISSNTWANFFIADRWKLFINNAAPAGTIQRNDDGTITLSMITAYCDIRQMFETPIEAGYYTLSAKINGEIRTLSGYFTGESELIDNNKGLVLGSTYFSIRCPEGSTITVEWAKLEKGKTATTFTPPNIAEEMPKCLRYYEKIEYSTTSGLAAVQWKNDVNNCTANIPFFTKRIASPTVTFKDNARWRFVSNTGVININSSTVQTTSANNVGVAFALASATTTPSFGWVDKFSVIIEAEL